MGDSTPLVTRSIEGLTNRSGANTDQQLIALWLKSKTRENTRTAYQAALGDFFGYVGNVSLAAITVADLENFKEHLELSGKATGTIQLKLNAVKSLLSYGAKTGYLTFNVGVAVSPPKSVNTLAERILDEREVFKLLDGCKFDKTSVMVHLLYYSAIRASELCNLKWKDFQANGSTYQITVTESKSETRSIPLGKKVVGMILEYKPDDAKPDDYVFPGRDGRKMLAQSVYMTVKRLGDKVGVKVSPHYFRHSHASHALNRGASIGIVRDTLGHKNIVTTNKYTHARPNDSSSLYLSE